MKKITVLLIVLFMLAGCALFGNNAKQFQDMSPKEKATFFFKVYNGQYDNYQIQTSKPDLTEVQKRVLRKKRDALTKMDALITAFDIIVNAGAVPLPQDEKKILDIIDLLANMAI